MRSGAVSIGHCRIRIFAYAGVSLGGEYDRWWGGRGRKNTRCILIAVGNHCIIYVCQSQCHLKNKVTCLPHTKGWCDFFVDFITGSTYLILSKSILKNPQLPSTTAKFRDSSSSVNKLPHEICRRDKVINYRLQPGFPFRVVFTTRGSLYRKMNN